MITFRGKTSNEALDTILRELSNKVILPSYLPMPLQKKVFRARWKDKLEIDPIELEIDGKQVRFKHIEKVPNAKKEFFKAMDLMETKQDWAALPRLLEGLWYHAQRRFEPGDWPLMIRKAAQAGNLGPMFDAARRPARTGMVLGTSEVAQEFMSAIVWQATGGGGARGEGKNAAWTPEATAQAVRDSARVVAFLQEKDHELTGMAKMSYEKSGMRPLRRDPQMMAHPVLFAAAMVVMHGKREFMVELRKYAALMLERWPEGKGLLELHPHTAYIDPNGVEYLMEKGKFLIVASPILRGFDLAIEALGSDSDLMGKAIKSRRDAVAEEVKSALAAKGNVNTRGKRMHERVFQEYQAPKPKAAAKADIEVEAEAKAEAKA